jgi:hypothetical protein
MKKIVIMSAISILALTGCATDDYKRYSETQAAIASARSNAEVARYQALAEIARSGDSTAKVAAVMSLQMGVGQGASQPQQIALPRTAGDVALQWASILLPSLTQVYGINANRQVAITQSNNQAAVAQNTNNTFATMNAAGHTSNVAISGQGFTAVTGVANAGLTAVTAVANTGIGQVGTTAASGLTAVTAVNASSNTAITNVSNAANESIQAISVTIPQIQPNVTSTSNTTTTTTTTNNTTTPTEP